MNIWDTAYALSLGTYNLEEETNVHISIIPGGVVTWVLDRGLGNRWTTQR